MSKLFSRSRSASAKQQLTAPTPAGGLDEFGRVNSRGSGLGVVPSGKKEKEKSKSKDKDKVRQRTISTPHDNRPISTATTADDPPPLPDGTFLPTSLNPDEQYSGGEAGEPKPKEQQYGYLAWENHVILGLDDVLRLLDVVGEELGSRGLTTPLLFSPMALDISPPVIKRLITAFLHTCPGHLSLPSKDAKWREEARFAGPHELAMVLRWGLARIVRIHGGVEVHGFLDWDAYLQWRLDEEAARYPADHFAAFLPGLLQPIRTLLTRLLNLMSRLTTHSQSSGLTPPTLASLFGPLFFGLGPTSRAFRLTYGAYLRASHATEHLLLSFIRWQESQSTIKSALPSRLRDWVRGYPSMIPALDKIERSTRGARTVRICSVRRNVRLYSPDLVKTGASWVAKGQIEHFKEWNRIAPPALKLPPRYSDSYRKRMDLPSNFYPDLGPGVDSSSPPPTAKAAEPELGIHTGAAEDRFRSLTELKWGEFEAMGFSSGDETKLQFDLNEGARQARSDKRTTLTWNDFSNAGFTRTDAPLSATLQFSTPIATSISSWPTQSAEIQRKLKKTQKALPAFGWVPDPVLGGEEIIEESFMECFCDLIYGSGWMERGEGTFRECNWALVEFKSLPQTRSVLPPSGDPRTDSTIILFEEFVPAEYQAQLTAPKRKMRFAPFSSKTRQWKPAPTLNGRPYVPGAVPRSPSDREAEFEGILTGGSNITKVISLGRPPAPPPQPVQPPPAPVTDSIYAPPAREQRSPLPAPSPSKGFSRFTLGRSGRRGGVMIPSEYDPTLEFETRTASYSEGEGSDGAGSPTGKGSRSKKNHSRKQSKDDAWVDILVADQNRRALGQDAEFRSGSSARLRNNHSDPELAREEIAKALAGIGQRPSDDMDAMIPSTAFRGSIDSQDDYGPPEAAPVPVLRVNADSPPPNRDSLDSADFEPMQVPRGGSVSPSREIEIPSFVEQSSASSSHPDLSPHADPATLIPSQSNPRQPSPTRTQTTKHSTGVSSLIEMYRERERAGTATELYEPKPSRLPVRTQPPGGKSSPEPQRSPKPAETALPIEEPSIGRITPPRYVHGAPLHNVAEADEEE